MSPTKNKADQRRKNNSAPFSSQLERMFARLDRYAVIILDDIGYVKKSVAETHVLFELIAHRYESKSMIITANHPFSDWDHIFADYL
jgi:DNA replication protein DnaC